MPLPRTFKGSPEAECVRTAAPSRGLSGALIRQEAWPRNQGERWKARPSCGPTLFSEPEQICTWYVNQNTVNIVEIQDLASCRLLPGSSYSYLIHYY
jgi:hypothetical protein